MLVPEGLVSLHRAIQLQLLQHYWLGRQRGGSGKAKVYYTNASWREKAWCLHRATWERYQGGQEAGDLQNEGDIQVMALIWIPLERQGRAGSTLCDWLI